MEEGVKDIKDIKDMIKSTFSLPEVDLRTYSPLTLAYIGDAVYEIIIRSILVGKGNAPVDKLSKAAAKLVRASAQKDMLHAVEEFFSEEEHDIYKRGRNAKSFSSAKNASITDYRTATGLEALIGYLYLKGENERILKLLKVGCDKLNVFVVEN